MNIAGVKSDQKYYTEALESVKKAMAIAEEIRDTTKLSICLTNIGNIYLKMNNNQALEYLQRALAMIGNNDIKLRVNIMRGQLKPTDF
jgi:tetratricopeptide (TPR) repeat protein